MRNYSTLLLLLICLGGLSCKKFLKERDQSEMTPVTTESYSELFFGSGYPLSTTVYQQATSLMDDDMQVYFGNYGDKTLPPMVLPAFSWQADFFRQLVASNFDPSGINTDGYKSYYTSLVGCNIAIQYADGSIGSQADKDFLKGQAFALRAYYYLQLVNLYGRPYNDSAISPDKSPGVPLILSSNLYTNQPARNSVAEVYDQILRDLDSASARLDGERRTGDVFRLDHISTHLLASRANLYIGRWDDVIRHASYVLQYHPQLMDLNSWGLSTGWNPGQTPFKTIIGNGNVETLWAYGSIGENVPLPVIMQCDVSQDLANQFDSADLRAQIYFFAVPAFLQQYVSPYYSSLKRDPSLLGAGYAAIGCSFRSSEAYLNRAEAYAQKYLATGDPNAARNALNDLNTLRAKRYDPSVFRPLGTMTADSLLQFCRNERRREFFGEGHRWFDLRRYGMPSITHLYSPAQGTTQKYVLNAHDPQYTLQIPPTALLLNPNLAQNPAGPVRGPSN